MIHVCRRPLFTRILPVIHFPDNFEQLLTDRRDRDLVADAGCRPCRQELQEQWLRQIESRPNILSNVFSLIPNSSTPAGSSTGLRAPSYAGFLDGAG